MKLNKKFKEMLKGCNKKFKEDFVKIYLKYN